VQGSGCNAKGLSNWSNVSVAIYCHNKDMKRVHCGDNVQGCTYVGQMPKDSDEYARTAESGCSAKDQIEVFAGVHVEPAKGGPLKRQEDGTTLCVYLPGRRLQCWCTFIGCDKKFALAVWAG
jgi:hypothetical protein